MQNTTSDASEDAGGSSAPPQLDLEVPTFKPADKIELAMTENTSAQSGDADTGS